MTWTVRVFFAVVALSVCSITVLSQPAKKADQKMPELKIRIIPDKQTYALHEVVFTRTEFTNLTDKTLCFPEPVQGKAVSTGYLITDADAPNNERDRFIEVFDGGLTWPREKLLLEIERNWLKLAPNSTHTTKSAPVQVKLDIPGEWHLRATYHPVECSFNYQECMKYLISAAEEVGCFVPEVSAEAKPVAITVLPPSHP